ncbi:hypothetical protein JTE90_016164 [Oedothorax gibbosus]|uniref:Uncharacterized protein n=1 Tax=Oedothorax gibbosus TaxID=931172 RepID=A0AAV6UUY3_9ARAC|nr:hypothetical protein JTE90_016164 [Oedothorax gibbosus]
MYSITPVPATTFQNPSLDLRTKITEHRDYTKSEHMDILYRPLPDITSDGTSPLYVPRQFHKAERSKEPRKDSIKSSFPRRIFLLKTFLKPKEVFANRWRGHNSCHSR